MLANGGEIAFPNSNDSPPSFAQLARYEPIARNILLKLRQPEFNARFRCVTELAAGMSMPEAAVNEYGNSMLWKNEIRFSEYVLISPPTGDSEMSEQVN